jgi:hypothetical protein
LKAVLAQIAVNPPPAPETPSGQITLNPNVIGGLGGVGVMIWAAVQIALKVWESKESTKTKTLEQNSEAKIEQNNEALSTLVEVFRKGQEADDALQAKSFESMSQLISQLNSIKANASEQLVENLMARMEAYDKNQLAINEAFRQTNIAIADLAELIKKVDWRGDTSTQEIRQYFIDFNEAIKRIHSRIDNAVERTN